MTGFSRTIIIGALLAAFSMAHAGVAYGGECKRKTAGFFLQFANEGGPHRLVTSIQSIPGPLTGALGNPERGREILVSQQKGDCLSCHKVRALASVGGQGGMGPELDGVGIRYNDGQLRQIIVDAKAYFPNTIMPSYYRAEGAKQVSILTAPEVEDLVAYMKTLK